jgi:hypothetical protein
MAAWSRHAGPWERRGSGFRDPILVLHIGGFALYVGLISYLMVRGIDEREVPVLLYGAAMSLHFLSTGHSLHREHGRMYDACGRWALALAALGGWLCGVLVELPKPTAITLLGLVSGGVVMNSMIAELPGEKDGRFVPYVLGAAAYAMLLFFVSGRHGRESQLCAGWRVFPQPRRPSGGFRWNSGDRSSRDAARRGSPGTNRDTKWAYRNQKRMRPRKAG